MGSGAPPSGSNKWMGEKWPGTPRTTHQGIFPSFQTYTPPKNTTTTMMTTQPGPYQDGSYLHWEGAAPPSLPSAEHSTSLPSTTGVSWLKSIITVRYMNNASHCAARLTSLSKRYKWRE